MYAPARKHLALVFGLLFAGSPLIASADNEGDTRTVNCAAGGSIQDALAKKKLDRPLTVTIRGACTENVTLTQDDITLQGDGGSITGSVTVDGARRAVVAGLGISNPTGNGVTITNGASVTLRDNRIDDSSGYGVFVRHASFAVVNDNTMLRNGIVNNSDVDASGIGVAQGSMVRAARNEIADNANTGIEVFDNSTYRSEGDRVAMRASAPGRSAVDTFRAGVVDLRGATVSGHVFVNQQAQFQSRNLEGLVTTLSNGNIGVSGLSYFRLRAGVVRAASTLGCNSAPGSFAVCVCDGFPGSVCPVAVP